MKRIFALVLCAVLLIGVIAPVSAAAPQEALLTAQEWDVLLLTNRERLRCGLAPVSSTPFLQEACDTRADEIAALFSHTRPDGSDCFSVLAGHSRSKLGEHIAAGYPTPADAVQGWMNSPGHRRNILSADFAHMGVGHAYHASGAYGNYWVQLFYTDSDCTYRSMRLAGSAAVSVACKSGITCFFSGMAMGFDLMAAETVFSLKGRYPDIRLIAVVPFRRQNCRWPSIEKERYQKIISQADRVIVLSEHYFKGCLLRRNDFMLEHSCGVIAFYDDKPYGGTFYTCREAVKKGMDIVNLY